MSSYVFLIYFSVAVLTIVSATPADEKHFDCPVNERYYKCQHLQCFKTCDHLKNIPPCPVIAADCYDPACLCDFGYLRNSEGKCVPHDKCS